MLTQRQLDTAIDSSKDSYTRLIRNLVSVFFTPEQLAVSSAFGNRQNPALDGDIVEACIRKEIFIALILTLTLLFACLYYNI